MIPQDEILSASVGDEKLRVASKWRAVEQIPDFPCSSFSDLRAAIEAGQCYLGVDQGSAYQHAQLVQGLFDRLFGLGLTSVPLLACLVSLIAAIVGDQYLLLFGIPIALVALVAPMMGKPVRLLIDTAAADRAVAFPLRLFARLISGLTSPLPATIFWLVLFVTLLFSQHHAGTWLVGTYIFSSQSIRWFRARGAIAVRVAAAQSETFFLYVLSHGSVAVINRRTNRIFFSNSRLPWPRGSGTSTPTDQGGGIRR